MRHGDEGNWHRRVARVDEGRENRLRKREAANDRPGTARICSNSFRSERVSDAWELHEALEAELLIRAIQCR